MFISQSKLLVDSFWKGKSYKIFTSKYKQSLSCYLLKLFTIPHNELVTSWNVQKMYNPLRILTQQS